jgi:branched-chain amino acid transport system permease protein
VDTVLQLILNALHTSSLYALVALGLTLVLGVLDIADFAQGALYMAGAYVAFYATSAFGLSFFLALPLAMLVAGLLGVANYVAVYRPLRRFSGATTFIAALGLLLILQNLALLAFGADFRLVRNPFPGVRIALAGATITGYQAFLAGAMVALVGLVWLFLKRTPVGKALRAVSQNRGGALVVGLDPFRVEVAAFALAGALAGAAGTLASAVNAFDPHVAATVVIKAFAIVIFGGMGSVPGAIVGAVVVGLAENLTGGLVSTQYAELTAFVLMVVVLLVRPRGLFGAQEAKL